MALPVASDSAAIAMFRLVLEEYLSLGRLHESIALQAENGAGGQPDRRRLMAVPGVAVRVYCCSFESVPSLGRGARFINRSSFNFVRANSEL
jgi:hypothetical protein